MVYIKFNKIIEKGDWPDRWTCIINEIKDMAVGNIIEFLHALHAIINGGALASVDERMNKCLCNLILFMYAYSPLTHSGKAMDTK